MYADIRTLYRGDQNINYWNFGYKIPNHWQCLEDKLKFVTITVKIVYLISIKVKVNILVCQQYLKNTRRK